MKVTFEDIRKIIDGSKIEIATRCPFGEGQRWFMLQPTDYLYDNAIAVREAIEAQLREDESVKLVENLPPSKEWVNNQELAIANARKTVAELEEKGDKKLPEEYIELDKQKDYLARLIDPKTYTRADEIVSKRGKKAFETWLMPRLIVDENNKPLFQMDKEEGRALWDALGMQVKFDLRLPFYQAIDLVFTAKNF